MNLLAGDLGGTKTILAIYTNESYPKILFKKYYISSYDRLPYFSISLIPKKFKFGPLIIITLLI